jgi:hypothetical protein
MKKHFIYATLSAIALFGAVSFSACSSSEDVAEDINPTYDGNSVKTQFTISLPFNNNATTRQTSAVVQQAEDINSFRGIEEIKLIPFQSSTSRTSRLGENITLGAGKMSIPSSTTDNAANTIPAARLLDANNNAVLYNDVTIPVGTSAFIFYGKAIGNDGFENGSLTAAGLTGETSGITFTPTPAMPNNPDITIGTDIATYVSSIAAASFDNNTPSDTSDDIANIWAKCANTANSAQPWYNAALGKFYTAFTSLKAGGSSYVMAAVQDLYASIYQNSDLVSLAIKKAILNPTYASDASNTGVLTFTEKIAGSGSPAVGYPANINMPEGAAALSWTDTSTNPDNPKVASAVAGSNFGLAAMNVISMTSIVYPASLYYYMDSPIKVSNTSRAADYVSTNTWTTILSNYSEGSVSSATRSVAVTNPIQYAVGRLDVKVNPLSLTKYYDRKGEEVVIPAEGYQLTGVLIGGQKVVDYKFEPTGTAEYAIYDKMINTTSPSTSSYVTSSVAAGPNYTLALETAADTKVYVALEFLNNSGKDFEGVDGIVKKNCKFYMIAQLDPTSTSTNGTNVTNTGNRVFKKDFKTIAGFTFGAGSQDLNTNGTADGHPDGIADTPGGFANAYTTIPDLRTPQLELGLSVNLEWQEGITFTVTF